MNIVFAEHIGKFTFADVVVEKYNLIIEKDGEIINSFSNLQLEEITNCLHSEGYYFDPLKTWSTNKCPVIKCEEGEYNILYKDNVESIVESLLHRNFTLDKVEYGEMFDTMVENYIPWWKRYFQEVN